MTNNVLFTNCTNCTRGYYKDAIMTSCTVCGVGTYSNTEGAVECSGCVPGQYAGEEGLKQCDYCPKGKYSDSSKQSACRSVRERISLLAHHRPFGTTKRPLFSFSFSALQALMLPISLDRSGALGVLWAMPNPSPNRPLA